MKNVYIVAVYTECYENDPGTLTEHSYHETAMSANIVCNFLNAQLKTFTPEYYNPYKSDFHVMERILFSVTSVEDLGNNYRCHTGCMAHKSDLYKY